MQAYTSSFLRQIIRLVVVSLGCLAVAAVAHAQAVLTSGQVGVAYSFTITTNPAAAAGTVYQATNLPAGLAINASSGTISGTPTTPGISAGTISLTSNGSTNNFDYQLTIAPVAGTSAITSATTATGQVSAGFTYTVMASNSPTGFNVTGLPPGLTATPSTGAISGTPTTAGTYLVSLSANNAAGTGAAVTLTLTISPAAGTPAITSPTTATGVPSTAFTYTITASNGPTQFFASGLPVGLSLNSTTGVISGTPTVAGGSTVALSAANASGTGPTQNLAVTIGAVPVITNPSSIALTAGAVNLQLAATPVATNFNVTGLPTGLSVNSTGLITGTLAVGNYSFSASGNNGTGTGPVSTIALSVTAPSGGGGGATAPTIVTQPAAVTVTTGGTATFTVAATTSSGTLSYQWLFNSAAISGATSSTYTVTNVQASNAGLYSVTVSNGLSVASTGALLTVTALVVPPTITTAPTAQTTTAGGSVTFSVAAGGSGNLTYQWLKDGVAISGATNAALTLNNLKASDGGSYSVMVSNGTTQVTSAAAQLTVNPAPSRLVNVSFSGMLAAGNQGTVVVGFSLGGTGTKNTLIRAIGPTLASFNVANPLANPALTVFSAVPVQIGANDDWGGSPSLSTVFAQTGAFALPATSKDAAILLPLAPGQYTARVSSVDGTGGPVLLEAYDADTGTPTARFVNLSSLGTAGSGVNAMTIGFSISGTTAKTLLIRGIGPSLSLFNVPSPLASTQLTVIDSNFNVLGSSSVWSSSLSATFLQVNAFPLPAGSKDSALQITLQPGIYTVQLSAPTGTTGSALIELYEVQ